jgi:Ca2+-binding RTX toxin-like protein
VHGFGGVADTLDGKTGNDTLIGYSGSDTYLHNLGDGEDRIVDGYGSQDTDRLVLGAGFSAGDVTVARYSRETNHVVLKFAGSSDLVVVHDQLYSSYGMEQIQFNDGTVWSKTDIVNRLNLNPNLVIGTSESETLSGSTADDTIEAGAGADTLNGLAGQDVLRGGVGNDTLRGDAGADTLDGGGADDSLVGGTGSDAFVFATGFGLDSITDFQAGAATEDVIEFSSSVFADFAAVLGASTQSGNNVVITADASNAITRQSIQLSSLHTDDFRFV